MVVVVFGARADAGVATVAAALALAFRSLGGDDVALAELDPRLATARADAGNTVRGGPAANGGEPVGDGDDRVVIPGTDAVLVKGDDGVWTLTVMRSRAAAAGDAKAVAATIDAMRDRFPTSVAALGHQVNERTLAAFDGADRILLITEGAVPSLRGTQRVLRLCRRLNYPDEKMCVVVNRFDAPGSLSGADISAALRREVFWKIPAARPLEVQGLAGKLLER